MSASGAKQGTDLFSDAMARPRSVLGVMLRCAARNRWLAQRSPNVQRRLRNCCDQASQFGRCWRTPQLGGDAGYQNDRTGYDRCHSTGLTAIRVAHAATGVQAWSAHAGTHVAAAFFSIPP